ncbi:hypothetical protein BDW59DRAFT_176266 [Aspergillus cavernicola]|uniref:F-box domain-containing protein n=1 Tax=Aspergillus cavernicola TaxID=176166 RepID=A0ABR4HI09_9EURO
MDEIDKLEDTGDIGDLDETDQLPVKITGKESNPLCYICNSILTEFRPRPKFTTGVYSGEAMMSDKRFSDGSAWNRFYRMILFHLRKRICRLSGISYFTEKDLGFHTRQAPWDENTLIVRSESNARKYEDLLATALQHEAQDPFASDRLTCFVIHARCWQLLCRHKAWSLAGEDIKIVLGALRCKSARYWKQSLYPLQDFIDTKWTDFRHVLDPFVCHYAQNIIAKTMARRRTRKRFQPIRGPHKRIYLNCLPPEILLLIADLLPSTDVAVVQKAMGSYLGDAYWRSRIPCIFHEIRDVSSELLDWEHLCSELERLEDWDEQLTSRRYVLGQLDEIAGFIANHSNYT